MHRTGLIEYETAIAVAKHRSFRAAADELGMSSTAVSSLVRNLEARIGVRIFHRTTRSVSITAAGERFLDRVKASVSEISEAIDVARGHAGKPTGTLRINTSVTAGHEVLDMIVGTYLERYPEICVELITDTRLVDIVLQGCDAGIRTSNSVPGDMVAIPLGFSLDFSIVGSPDYFLKHSEPDTPFDLTSHSCIRSRWPSGGIYQWEFAENGQPFQLDVPGSIILDEQSLILKAAKAGLGIAYLADAMTRDAVASGELRRVLEGWRPVPDQLSIYYPRNRHTPAALRAFVEIVRQNQHV
ncbi:LysR family transcriptional regulator [Rhizobium ruizarguesonis]|uniref:LysR family transcriptional regulator n=1 Tax=Rhizobium ruizarguesonis TaxID=2081791 RepID=UPI00103247EF|nr:LysR family transcriptional regulator [Rhizobium ruizarguesonis]TAT96128.1 LysR family transcriptional regulator [Rhizobium ruizarguesonis]